MKRSDKVLGGKHWRLTPIPFEAQRTQSEYLLAAFDRHVMWNGDGAPFDPITGEDTVTPRQMLELFDMAGNSLTDPFWLELPEGIEWDDEDNSFRSAARWPEPYLADSLDEQEQIDREMHLYEVTGKTYSSCGTGLHGLMIITESLTELQERLLREYNVTWKLESE